MVQSPFARSLVISACVSGVVFSIATAPFALFKSNIIGVEVQNRDVYSAELKYLAGPYLALSGGMSAAVGLGIFGLMGLRQSTRKIAEAESAQQEIVRSLAVNQAELERIKFSEARLRSQNLNAFLQPAFAETPVAQISGTSQSVSREAFSKAISEVPPSYAQPGRLSAMLESPQELVQPVALEIPRSVYESSSEPGHEPLENLLQQLHQISQQVEELRGRPSNQLAACNDSLPPAKPLQPLISRSKVGGDVNGYGGLVS